MPALSPGPPQRFHGQWYSMLAWLKQLCKGKQGGLIYLLT